MCPPEPHTTSSARLPGPDLLRVVATVAVIVTHASHWPATHTASGWHFWADVDQATRFAVPAFLVLSGLVLAYRYGDRQLTADFLVRRARRSVLPFIVWAPVYLMIGLFITHHITQNRAAIVEWWLEGAGHLYFLLIIPQFYLLYMIWPRRRAWVPAVTVAALAVQLALCGWRLYTRVPTGIAWWLAMDHGFEFFPFWIGYFAIGLWLGALCVDRNGMATILGRIGTVGTPIVAVPYMLWGTTGAPYPGYGDGTGGFLVPLLVPVVVALCLAGVFSGGTWMLHRGTFLRRVIDKLSAYSLGIYIVHPFLLEAPGDLLHGTFARAGTAGSILPEVALVAATLLMSVACVRLLAATPLAVTLGVPREPIARPAWLRAGSDR